MNNEEKIVTKNNVEIVEKKDVKIKQRPKKTPKVKSPSDKMNIKSIIWIVLLFVILFSVLFALPYVSNYR